MQGELEFYAETSLFMGRVELYLRRRSSQQVYHAEPIQLRPAEEGERPYPILSLKLDDARNLMNALWRCGVRPNSLNDIDPVRYHLEDMRRLVFRTKEDADEKNA